MLRFKSSYICKALSLTVVSRRPVADLSVSRRSQTLHPEYTSKESFIIHRDNMSNRLIPSIEVTKSLDQNFLTDRNLLTHGGSMQRFFIALCLILGTLGLFRDASAQYVKEVSGYILPSQTVTFYSRTPGNSLTDTIYRISGTL